MQTYLLLPSLTKMICSGLSITSILHYEVTPRGSPNEEK